MPVLANARYERFAQIVAEGKLVPTAAYREALGADARDPDVNSCRWMKKPPIAERIEELKAENSKRSQLSREQTIDWLASVILTPVGQVTKDSPLCQSYKDTGGIKEIRMPDKIAAVAQLAKICNWHVAQKVHLETGDTLTAFVQSLRKGEQVRAAGMLHNGSRN